MADHIVPTSNNITNNQPVPSVCVRVPHSPSLDSGGGESPPSPVDKPHHHDFSTLVVRESSTRIIYQNKKKNPLCILTKLPCHQICF